MPMTPLQVVVMVAAIAAGTALTRFLPFLLFPESKSQPAWLGFLGRALPPAMMGLLVVYCLRSVPLAAAPHGIPEALAIVLIVALHRWKGNVFLSIGAGTAFYMLLVQTVFA